MDSVGNEAIVDASPKNKSECCKNCELVCSSLVLKITYVFTNSIITDEQNEMIIAMLLLTFEVTLFTP